MSLRCPACGFRTVVLHRKWETAAANVIRRRTCTGCGCEFKTVERVVPEKESEQK